MGRCHPLQSNERAGRELVIEKTKKERGTRRNARSGRIVEWWSHEGLKKMKAGVLQKKRGFFDRPR